MKKLLILILLLAGTVLSQDWADTLESGSSDSLKKVTIDRPARLVTVAMKQLDTNATFPDSVVFYNNINNITAPVDFNCSVGDSLKSVLNFTYASSAGQIRTGWVWLPNTTSLWIRMSNSKYLANRRILIEVTITYY